MGDIDFDDDLAPAEDTPQKQQSYFGFVGVAERFVFDDGVSYVELKVMTEGDRRRFLDKTANDLRVQKDTGDALIGIKPGSDRIELLVAAISDWNLVDQAGKDVPFNDRNLRSFVEGADPVLVGKIEQAIRVANPWLLDDVSVENLDEQIAQLEELRDKKLEEDEGKAA